MVFQVIQEFFTKLFPSPNDEGEGNEGKEHPNEFATLLLNPFHLPVGDDTMVTSMTALSYPSDEEDVLDVDDDDDSLFFPGTQQECTAMILRPFFLPVEDDMTVSTGSTTFSTSSDAEDLFDFDVDDSPFSAGKMVIPPMWNVPKYDLLIEESDKMYYSCVLRASQTTKTAYRFKWFPFKSILGTNTMDYRVHHETIAHDLHRLTITTTKEGFFCSTGSQVRLYGKTIPCDDDDDSLQSLLFYSEPMPSHGNKILVFHLKVWHIGMVEKTPQDAMQYVGKGPQLGLLAPGGGEFVEILDDELVDDDFVDWATDDLDKSGIGEDELTPSTDEGEGFKKAFTPSTDEENQQECTAMILHPCFLPFDEEDGNAGAIVCRRSLPNLLGPKIVSTPVYDLIIEEGGPGLDHYSCTLLANKSVYKFKWFHTTNIVGTKGMDYLVRHRTVAPDVHHLTIAPTKTRFVGTNNIPELELYAKKLPDMGDGPAQSFLFYSEQIASYGNARLAFQLKVWVVNRDSAHENHGEIPKVGLLGMSMMQGQVMGADVPRLRSSDEELDIPCDIVVDNKENDMPKVGLLGTDMMQGQVMGTKVLCLCSSDEMLDMQHDVQKLVDITCDDEIFSNKKNDMTPKNRDGKVGSMTWESGADCIGSFVHEQTQLSQYHRFQGERKPFQEVTEDSLQYAGKNPQLGQLVMGTNVPLGVPELVDDKVVEWGTDEETTWDGATNEMGDNLEEISFAGMVEMQDFVELDTSDDDSIYGETTPEPTPLRRSRRLQEKMGTPGPKVVPDASVDKLIGKRMGKLYDSTMNGVAIGEAYYYGWVMEFSKEKDAYVIEFECNNDDKWDLFNEMTLRLLIADYEKNWKDFDTKPKY